ncbi:MAG: hypothetical protein FJ295_06690 [Planctomycetes bacterium]|nr:hypothetical protein [Planctomycetota bacterium]
MDARKATIPADEISIVLQGVKLLYATKGKKVIRLELKTVQPDEATLQSLLVGPSGNLRAPALRVGNTLLVGFDAEMYSEVLLKSKQ